MLVVATRQGQLLFASVRWQALKRQVLEQLVRFHEQEPDQLGPDRDRLRRFAALPLERPALSACWMSCSKTAPLPAAGLGCTCPITRCS